MVGEHAGHGDQVLDLLALEQSLAGLSGDRDAAPLQSLFVAPEIASGGCQQGDVAGSARAPLTAFRVADGLTANQACAHLGDGLGFAVPLLLGVGPAVFVGYRDAERGDRGPFGASWLEGIKGLEARLAVLL